MGHGSLRILSVRFHRSSPHNQENVEGQQPRPSNPSILPFTDSFTQNIDWCYIFYALQYQLSAILLATSPRWYLYQALGSNLLWMLPWAIVVTKSQLSEERAWTFYAVIFGGALVFSFLNVIITLGIWAWRLMKGKMSLRRVHSSL